MRNLFLLTFLIVLVAIAGSAVAEVYTVSHALITEGTAKQHTSINVYTNDAATYGIGAIMGSWSDGFGHETFMKYQIPTLAPDEIIESVVINIDVWQIYGSAPGCVAEYIPDDSWNPNGVGGAVNIPVGSAWDWDPSDPSVVIAASGELGVGSHSADITSFVLEPGEGSGQLLTVKLLGTGGGTRGAHAGHDVNLWPTAAAPPTLTITTIPEPMALALLAAGSLFAVRRKK